MASPSPTRKKVDDIKSSLLRPATTSHFDVFIKEPRGPKGEGGYTWDKFKNDNDLKGFDQNFLHLCCSETVLPGSSLTTHEINNDYTGVTERHAYRRLFDDRIDLTFYVMVNKSKTPGTASTYLPIRFFEGWIKYIASEKYNGNNNVQQSNYAYRMRYPQEYYGGLEITKYERDYNLYLKYHFLNAFPISVSSMPVSYDASSLLKCTVSLTYQRYWIEQVGGSGDSDRTMDDRNNPDQQLTPIQQAQFNSSNLTASGLTGSSALATPGRLAVGGIPQSAANSSGNAAGARDRRVEAGLPYVGRNVGPIAPFSGI